MPGALLNNNQRRDHVGNLETNIHLFSNMFERWESDIEAKHFNCRNFKEAISNLIRHFRKRKADKIFRWLQ
jgi:hypothetical protein